MVLVFGSRALLILDDIWDSMVLKTFDIHCRILLTTRNRSLTDSVSGKYTIFPSLYIHIHMQVDQTCCVFKIYTGVVLHKFVFCAHFFIGAKYELEVESGLNENKGLEILALYTNTKPHALPEEARSIVRECKGLYRCSSHFYSHFFRIN